ncbi:MAG: hypothetical protein H7255_08895 [Ramlibacter sp.]|nr:hypothetical protein [Ramlibacter sp.]
MTHADNAIARAAFNRRADLSEARALYRQHGIRDAAELLTVLETIASAIQCMRGSDLDAMRAKLIELGTDLEDEIGAANRPRECPRYSMERYGKVYAPEVSEALLQANGAW